MANQKQEYQCCIIGAGPAGIGTALELARHGITDTVIIDKNKTPGGLSRTNLLGGVRFDAGPHRFFTKNKEVNQIWHNTLGKDFIPVKRISHILYRDKFFKYPVEPFDVLSKLGLGESIESVFSFIWAQLNQNSSPENIQEWVTHKFGKKLYEIFFKTYTEKVWGVPCAQIESKWASQRIKGLDAWELIKNAFLGNRQNIKTLMDEFDFPVLGTGQMYETMCKNLSDNGLTILLETQAAKINRQGNTITSVETLGPQGKTSQIFAKYFFSSIPLAHLFQKLEPLDSEEINTAAKALRYRDHITVNFLVNKTGLFPDQWIYIQSPEIQMARLANYNNFSKDMIGIQNKTALGVEYFVFKTEGFWLKRDEELILLAKDEIEKTSLVNRKDIEKSFVSRETEAYPGYYNGYQKPLETLKKRLACFTNLSSIGRAGLHKYNNQDHSLLSGILSARNYLKLPGSPYSLWDINIDAEYQESAPR
ncbi:MAG: FAD-dependent oxidoreductase [Candidatus Omnitrophica bacterium]|jgi:protoporphyrinogen oxidase|nr:FAD-dependent oxidoreductase [Candidatus Omnitrophota bacterium]